MPMMTRKHLTACAALMLCATASHAQYASTAVSNERLNIKGLFINMPFDDAFKLIQASLSGGLNGKTCETRAIAPTDDTFAMGDLMISCEGAYKYFGEAITSFSAIFENKRLRFVGLGTFMSHSVASDQLPSVFRSLAEKFQVTPAYSTHSRYARFKIFDFVSSFTDRYGAKLESTGKVEYAPTGTLHQNVWIRLTPPDFVQYQQARIRIADIQMSNATNLEFQRKAGDL